MRAINPHAQRLRREMTDAERRIWAQVRGRRFGGFKFKRQWSLGPYVVDFCCIDRKLVVEIDGGQHSEARDVRRTKALEAMGYRVVRFWNNDVFGNLEGVLTNLLAELETGPRPGPLPQAGEGAEA